jgi:hypothetical protein
VLISWPHRAALIASAVIGVLGAAIVAVPASATDPDQRILISAGQLNCVDYSEGKIWQTSNNFARVRYRFCLSESSDASTVRPIVQVQFDWPVAQGCTLSVGFPPSAGVGCPIGATSKRTIIKFRAYQSINSKPVLFRIPLTIKRPNGLSYTGWCNYSPKDTSTNTTTYRRSEQDRPTLTCTGPTFKRLRGIYALSTPGPRGDIADDGAKERLLNAGSFEYISQ